MERSSNRFGILALHALIWTLPFGLFYAFEQPSVSQRFYFQVAVTTIALFYFAAGALGGSLRAPQNGVLGAAVLYGVCVTASSWVARSPSFTIKESLSVWCGILLLAILAHLRLTRGQSRRLLGSYVLVAGLIALYGVLQYLGLDFRLGRFGYAQDIQDGRFHVLSLLGHPNYLTAYIGPALLLIPGLMAVSPSRRWQVSLAVVAGIILLCIFVSGTRSAWLATLLLGGTMAIIVASTRITFRFERRAKIAILVAAGILALFVVHNPVLRHRYSFVDRLLDSRPVEGRLYFYLAATRMIGRHPILGVGYNNYGVQFWDYANEIQQDPANHAYSYVLEDLGGVRPDQTHNEYLQIAAETGFLGLATFLFLLAMFFRRVGGDYRREENWTERLLLAGLAGAAAFLLIDCLFSFPLRLPCSGMVFWLLLGIGSRYAQPEPLYAPAALGGRRGAAESQRRRRRR